MKTLKLLVHNVVDRLGTIFTKAREVQLSVSASEPHNGTRGWLIEKQQILSAARHDGVRQVFSTLRHGDFRAAWRWIVNSRKQTVRSVGNQQDGQIWVIFGVDEPGATDGYAIWARYIMTNHRDIG